MNTRLIVSSLILVTLMAFFPFSVASAGGPVIEDPIYEEGTVDVADCGSFQVLDVYELNYISKLYFDKEGNLVKIIEQVWGTDTFVNSVTGKTYPMSFHNTVVVHPPRAAITGIGYHLTIPGVGAVFFDVGRIVRDRQGNVYFEAGPHQFFNADFDALCAAME